MWRTLYGFLRKDAKLFAVDRQAVVMSFVVPVVIASILGWLDTSATDSGPQRVSLMVVDEDNSATSHAVIDKLSGNKNLALTEGSRAIAEETVRKGDLSAAAIFEKGFGQEALNSFQGGTKPEVILLTDPAKAVNTEIASGALMGDASFAVTGQLYGAFATGAGAPLEIKEVPAAAMQQSWGKAAHEYAGFGIMGLLFFSIEASVVLARERRLGIWKRLRSSPVRPWVYLLSRGISSTILSLAIILALFGIGAVLFHIRILGSVAGFLVVALATAIVAASFGLLISSIGKTESQSRGLAILLIMIMLATGGAWFPMERMPQWVQSFALYLPVRWSVEGFDAMTWRGRLLSDALVYAGVLGIFGAGFCLLACLQFRFGRSWK